MTTQGQRNLELVRRIKNGDREAEKLLIEANYGFIKYILTHSGAREDVEHYIGEAYIAVIRAARNFDESRGFSFTTFAGRYIYQSFCSQFRKEKSKEVSYSDWYENASSNRSIGEHHKKEPKCLAIEPSNVIDDTEEYELLLGEFRKNLQLLPPLIRRILLLRAEGKTLERVGKIINLTKERVRQLQDFGLKKLRDNCAEILVRLGLPNPPTKVTKLFRIQRVR